MIDIWYNSVMQAHIGVWEDVVGNQVGQHCSWNVRCDAFCLQAIAAQL